MRSEVETLRARAVSCVDIAAKAGDRHEFARLMALARQFNDMAEELEQALARQEMRRPEPVAPPPLGTGIGR